MAVGGKSMNPLEMKHWTTDQFLKYYIGKYPSIDEICSWTCGQLILYTFDQLQQPSGAVEMNLNGLVKNKAYGFASKKQEDMFFRLHAEANSMTILIHLLLIWLLSNKVIHVDYPEKVIRTDEPQFVTYFAEQHVDIKNILSWPDEQFIRYIYEGLISASATSLSVLDILLHKEDCGLTCNDQKDMLIWVQQDINIINWMAKNLHIWLSRKDGINSSF